MMMAIMRFLARLAPGDEATPRQHAVVVRGDFDAHGLDQRAERDRARKARLQVGAQMQQGGDEHVAGGAAEGIEMNFQHGAPF